MPYEFDAELAPLVAAMPRFEATDAGHAREMLAAFVALQTPFEPPFPLTIVDSAVPATEDRPPVPVRIYTPTATRRPLPAALYFHGGGFVAGDLDSEHRAAAQLAAEAQAVTVSVDYRLAPEHPFPAAPDDCYAALVWVAAHTDELGIDPERLAVVGTSAGGGLAAAVALLARDREGPALAFQSLSMPELDDRLVTTSMTEFVDTPVTNRSHSERSWRQYLPTTPGGPDVSPYAAPARAADLGGLPPAYVCVCEFDPLRDEGIDYAHRLVQAGVHTELHLYPGTFHGLTQLAENAEVSRRMHGDEIDAIRRALHGPSYARADMSDSQT